MIMKIILTTLLSFTSFFTLLSQPVVDFELFASGSLNSIVDIRNAGDDRLFAVLQGGLIRVVDADGMVQQTPFLDVRNKVVSGGERGLLGLEFHPDFQNNGLFFINYTRSGDGATVISKWSVNAEDPSMADDTSEQIIIVIPQPHSNHNGGDIKFGPDGYLYIGMGDGGSGGDPANYSQNHQSLLGKMLRIDVNVDEGYRIPDDNPFAMDDFTLDEIWALGVRNPWRFSFDAVTNDLWIADVGQNAFEEINRVSAASTGAENYGWRCYEGNSPFNLNGCGDEESYTFPVYDYSHSNGDQSVTGGYVYRGEDFPALNGKYIYGDFNSGRIFMLEEDNGNYSNSQIGSLGEFQISTFGVDVRNELYVAARGQGAIYRITEFCEGYKPTLTEQDGVLFVALNGSEWSDDFVLSWYDDTGFVTENQDSIFIPEQSGTYYVVLTHERGCELESDPVSVIVSSTTDKQDPVVVKVFPNPFANSFTIQTIFPIEVEAVLMDINGRRLDARVIPPDSQFIWNSDLPAGLYVIQIITNNGIWNYRVVKK